MLPVYISYFAGKKEKPLANSIGFVAGFTLVFVTLGAFAGAVGGFLQEYSVAVNIVTGAIVVLLGLNYLGAIRIPIPVKNSKVKKLKPLTFASSIIFGMVFAVAWTPCVGAWLGAALLRASHQGTAAEGALMLFAYSMGLGIPLVISAVLLNHLKGAFEFIKRNYRIINIIAGSMLVIIGILMMTGHFGRFMALFL